MEEETNKMVCKNCGAEIKEGNNFCTKCGMKVVENETVDKENNNQTTKNNEHKYIMKEKIGIIFIAIFVIIFMIYLLIRQGVIKVGGFYL